MLYRSAWVLYHTGTYGEEDFKFSYVFYGEAGNLIAAIVNVRIKSIFERQQFIQKYYPESWMPLNHTFQD